MKRATLQEVCTWNVSACEQVPDHVIISSFKKAKIAVTDDTFKAGDNWRHAWQCIWAFPIWSSHFVPVSVGHWGKWFLAFIGRGRLIHHQPSTVLHFEIFFIIFYWAAAVLCIFCSMRARDCPHECHVLHLFSSLTLVLFRLLQFASIVLCLIGHMHLLGSWTFSFFF